MHSGTTPLSLTTQSGDLLMTSQPLTQLQEQEFIVDNGTKGLARSGLNVTGTIAILNIGSWMTWAGLVEKHSPGEDAFGFNLKQSIEGFVNFHGKNSRYFLEDKLEFLDAPSEWFYDSSTKKLYLWLRESDHPNAHDIFVLKSQHMLLQ